jgi:UDP-glucose 4-epimerase
MDSRRILITGLSSPWGGRLAQALERDPSIDAIIGVDTGDPRHQLERTEFVRIDIEHARLRRIVEAAAIDTVIDTRVVEDSVAVGLKKAHAINVTGTRNLLAACGGAETPVLKLVFKSSAEWYGCAHDDPAFFTEEMDRSHGARTPIERDLVTAEASVAEFAARNRDAIVTVLRFTNPIGVEQRSSLIGLLAMPVVPAIFGFDPRCQFIHEEDVIGVLHHAARTDLPGTYNAAADGVLVLSELVSLLGKPLLPIMPPWGTTFAAGQLQRLGLGMPLEMLRQLQFGRGLDNRRLKASGYAYRYTSREAVLKLSAHQRSQPLLRSGAESYTYEREFEEFLRWSPSVQAARARADERTARPGAPPTAGAAGAGAMATYDELTVDELVGAIASMDGPALARLREYEATTRARSEVLEALDRRLSRKGFGPAAS